MKERFGFLATLLGLAALLGTQAAWIGATNFTGYDEWLILALAERGVLAVPHANRPLGMLWIQPAAFLAPHHFEAYLALGFLYVLLTALLAFAVTRRLAPGRPALALLVACFVLTWAPMDRTRLASFQIALYGGITFGTWLAIALLVESWCRRRAGLLIVAVLVAGVTARSYEASFGLLLAAPLLIAALAEERGRRFWAWAIAWEGAVLVPLVALVRAPAESRYYQAALGADLSPAGIVSRLVKQLELHLGPLLTTPLSLVAQAVPAVACAVAVFIVVFKACGGRTAEEPARGRALLRLTLLGLVLAAAGYSVFLLTPSLGASAERLQFLSGPGIAIALASVITLAASFLPLRGRAVGAALMAAWVVGIGTARTVDMQRRWDVASVYGSERRLLLGLLETAPALRDNTLVILLGDTKSWPSVAGFRYAVEYLYGPTVHGWPEGANDLFFDVRREAEGYRSEPWMIVRRPWGTDVSHHRFDEIVVLGTTPAGDPRIEEEWPASLGALPAGAVYEPRKRVLPQGPPRAERRVLESLPRLAQPAD